MPELTIVLPSSDPTLPTTSGQAAVAARIQELARAHGMNLRQDIDLAALLTAIHVGDPIPIGAFAVVADVLFSILNASQQHQTGPETTS